MKAAPFALMMAWFVTGAIGAGFYNASLIAMDPECEVSDRLDSRQKQVVSLMFGGIGGPVMLVAGFAISRFGEAGWTLAGDHCPRRERPRGRDL
jgi:hypothetical protein